MLFNQIIISGFFFCFFLTVPYPSDAEGKLDELIGGSFILGVVKKQNTSYTDYVTFSRRYGGSPLWGG